MSAAELPEPITLKPEMPDAPAGPAQKGQKPTQAYKQHYPVKKDLGKYGYTAACPACDTTRMGQRSGAVAHTTACRERIERALADDSERQSRLERTGMRQNQRMAKDITEGEERKRSRQEARASPPPGLDEPSGDAPMPAQVGGSSSSGSRPATEQPSGQAGGVPSTLAVPARRREDCPEADEPPSEGPHAGPTRGSLEQGPGRGPGWPRGRGDRSEAWGAFALYDLEGDLEALVLSLHEHCLMTVESRGDDQPVWEDLGPMEGFEEGWYVDDMSGKTAQPSLAQEAQAREIDIIRQMKVWEVVDRPKGPESLAPDGSTSTRAMREVPATGRDSNQGDPDGRTARVLRGNATARGAQVLGSLAVTPVLPDKGREQCDTLASST